MKRTTIARIVIGILIISEWALFIGYIFNDDTLMFLVLMTIVAVGALIIVNKGYIFEKEGETK